MHTDRERQQGGACPGGAVNPTRRTIMMAVSLQGPAREKKAAGKASASETWLWQEEARVMVLKEGDRIGSSREGEAEATWVNKALFTSTSSPSFHSKQPPPAPHRHLLPSQDFPLKTIACKKSTVLMLLFMYFIFNAQLIGAFSLLGAMPGALHVLSSFIPVAAGRWDSCPFHRWGDGSLESEGDSQLVVEPEFNPGVSHCKDSALSTYYSLTHSFNKFIFDPWKYASYCARCWRYRKKQDGHGACPHVLPFQGEDRSLPSKVTGTLPRREWWSVPWKDNGCVGW